jgi:nicotinamide-nucleotide amidase
MHAEIIAIGDEIINGQQLDTNSPWLSRRLEELGVRVLYHSTVGDELDACTVIFRRAIDRADIVIATGGLGPTADDLTREALSLATARQLELFPQAMEDIRNLFARRQREMPEQNKVQAMFPAGSRMIINPNGTAPGIDLESPRPGKTACRFFALPGVPAELIEMWNATVGPEIGKMAARGTVPIFVPEKMGLSPLERPAGPNVIRRRKINCFGAGESQVEAMLPDLIRRGRKPTVGITASKTTISLRITAEAATEAECNALIEPTAATIRKCLGTLVYGEDDDELQHAAVRLLQERNKTLATVEWGTAGLVTDWLGDIVGQTFLSAVNENGPAPFSAFLGGLVVQNYASLARLLDLDQNLMNNLSKEDGEDLAKLAAAACLKRFGADYALFVGPFPIFDANSPKPVYLALADADGVSIKSILFAGHPATLRIFIAKHALNFVRLSLIMK